MFEFILLVLVLSLIFYVIFAGADFGAGIYEFLCLLSKRPSRKELVEKAIGPIWEANHIWLILVIVIFFMGFPKPFMIFSNLFHIPLVFVIIGIIFRGTAFAFRHYDPIQDGWQDRYTWMFALSSVWTSFWQGVIVGSLFSPLPSEITHFRHYFIDPWLNPFSFSTGIFVMATYLFLAQTFFLSEAPKEQEVRQAIRRDIWKSLLFVFISGSIVFITAFYTNKDFINAFFANTYSIILAAVTTLLLIPLIMSYRFQWNRVSRVIVALQVAMIMGAVLVKRFPDMIYFQDGSKLTFFEAAAPPAVITQLFIALLVGVILILPFLIYLLKVFKSERGIIKEMKK